MIDGILSDARRELLRKVIPLRRLAQPDDYGTALARILREKTYHRSWFGRIEGYGRKWLP